MPQVQCNWSSCCLNRVRFDLHPQSPVRKSWNRRPWLKRFCYRKNSKELDSGRDEFRVEFGSNNCIVLISDAINWCFCNWQWTNSKFRSYLRPANPVGHIRVTLCHLDPNRNSRIYMVKSIQLEDSNLIWIKQEKF